MFPYWLRWIRLSRKLSGSRPETESCDTIPHMPHTPQVSVYIAVTLDGMIAREDGGLDWLRCVQVAGEDYGYAAFMATVDVIVMGRRTYDEVSKFPGWPFEGKRVIVVTHRAMDARVGVTTHAGPLGPLLEKLAHEKVRRVYVDGGTLVRQGLQEKRVDDLTLSVIPVILGRGIPLFGPGTPEVGLRFVGSRSYASGLVQVEYRRG